MQRASFDVVVVGAGPAGAVTAAFLRDKGLSVLLLERERFPRFHVGESLTGTAGDLLTSLGLDDTMEALDFVPKPGVKVYGRGAKSEFYVPVLRPTWQVRRAEFDDVLLDVAKSRGAVYRLGSVKRVLSDDDGRVRGVAYVPRDDESQLVEVDAKVVVDASGQHAFLSTQGIAGHRQVEAFNRQIAVFSHYEGVEREPSDNGSATVILYGDTLHWAWMIPISSTTVSIGVVLPTTTYKRHGATPQEVMDWGLAQLHPELTRRTKDATQMEPVRANRNYSYKVEPFAGPGWLCVGDSHRFSDPIFSFGVSFAMTEAKVAADAIAEAIEHGDDVERFARYEAWSTSGHEVAFDLIRYFWKFPGFFAFMTRGKHAHDVIRLLAGDCFDGEIEATRAMRESLRDAASLEAIPDGPARKIAERVHERYDFFQGVEAALLDVDDDGVRLSFVMSDDDGDMSDSLRDFEAALMEDFGPNRLAIESVTRDAAAASSERHRIFDRRNLR